MTKTVTLTLVGRFSKTTRSKQSSTPTTNLAYSTGKSQRYIVWFWSSLLESLPTTWYVFRGNTKSYTPTKGRNILSKHDGLDDTYLIAVEV